MKLTIKYIIIFIFLFFFSLEVLFEKIRINSVSFHPQDIERKKIANKSNIKFDNRSKVQVIKDFRNNGIDVYPNIGPEFYTSHFKVYRSVLKEWNHLKIGLIKKQLQLWLRFLRGSTRYLKKTSL